MAPNISIIIPVYNSGDYLKDQVESILAQTFKDFELLLIDDGSTDGITPKLCDELAEKDDRIKVFHKQNGGVSDARNYGLDHAVGEFIVFADSDDYLFDDYLQTMVGEIEEFDVLISNMCRFTREELASGSYKRKSKKTSEVSGKFDSMKDALPLIGYKHTSVCNQLFRREIIEREKLRFQNIECEDELFSFQHLSYLNSIKKIDYEGYCYFRNPNSRSSTHKIIAEMNWIRQVEGIYEKLETKYPPTDSFRNTVNQRIAHRLSPLCFKGYHFDSFKPLMQRIMIWESVRNDRWLKTRIKLSKIHKIDAVVLLIARLRLFYLLDPFFMMMIRWRDHK